MKCDFGEQCEINVNNRHVCSACRLNKSFAVGMCAEMIRPSRTYNKKKMNTLSITNRNNKISHKVRF
jgi:hypothetical protein